MKSALLSAGGIGDGLLMMIAARRLKELGHDVTLFHEKASVLRSLFPDEKIAPPPSAFDEFDLLLVENDNSKRAWDIIRARHDHKRVHFFFPTPSKAQQKEDFLFDKRKPVALNIAEGCAKLFGIPPSKENGLIMPKGALFERYPRRIALHPTSADVKRNWLPIQYLKLARLLKKRGFDVAFTVSAEEHPYWRHVEEEGFSLPYFTTLSETAYFLYESGFFIGNDSGLGHLASNLGVSTLTISGNHRRVRLWRPDWAPGAIITPPFPLPNFKGINFRARENWWPLFVGVKRVMRAFLKAYESRSLSC